MIPRIYADWMDVLDLLESGNDDNAVMEAFQKGHPLEAGRAQARFMEHFLSCVDARLNGAKQRFSDNLAQGDGSDAVLVQNLLYLRRMFSYFYHLVGTQVFPQAEQTQIRQQLQMLANQTQQALEQSAQSDIYGRRESVIRTNPVNVFEGATHE